MTTISEETYNVAVKAVAEIAVSMTREYNYNVEDQRGEVGNYLATMIEDIHTEIEKLLNK
ncbi:hypothetical protein LCGC14_1562500 [marine sediment metagenome]|uniref:Uncharacterized protein n=1 Tax=marine sediment metagenome TaxID=412755 RepID=A0A0F9LMP9_9ZZZZ